MSGRTPLHTRRLKVLDGRGPVVGEKEVVLYRGLLEMIHDERLHEVHTELVQAPSEDNHDTVIVRATVPDGRQPVLRGPSRRSMPLTTVARRATGDDEPDDHEPSCGSGTIGRLPCDAAGARAAMH